MHICGGSCELAIPLLSQHTSGTPLSATAATQPNRRRSRSTPGQRAPRWLSLPDQASQGLSRGGTSCRNTLDAWVSVTGRLAAVPLRTDTQCGGWRQLVLTAAVGGGGLACGAPGGAGYQASCTLWWDCEVLRPRWVASSRKFDKHAEPCWAQLQVGASNALGACCLLTSCIRPSRTAVATAAFETEPGPGPCHRSSTSPRSPLAADDHCRHGGGIQAAEYLGDRRRR